MNVRRPDCIARQARLVLPGYDVVALPLAIAAKFALLLSLAVPLTMRAYHWLIRPFALSARLG